MSARRLYRAYIDEAGDRGLSATASPYFILAAVIVRDDHDADLRATRDQLCADLGKPPSTVLHWSKNITSHSHRLHAAEVLGGLDYIRLCYVIVDKDQTRQASNPMTDTRMYNYALRRLLERISWCVNNKFGEAIVTLAHIRRFQYDRLHSYVEYLESSRTSIEWRAIRGRLRIESQQRVKLLQAADIAAGCLYAATTPDRYGNSEPRYLEQVRPRIDEREDSKVTSYGLNVVGTPDVFIAKHPWWAHIIG